LQRASIERKRYTGFATTPTHIIFPKEKRKKKKAIHQVEGCKDARAVRYEPFIYPCFFVRPELTFAALFISFGLIITATLGVVVGVLVDRYSARVCKTFATAFGAANSFLVLAFTIKKSTLQKLKAICCLSASAWGRGV